MAEVEWWGGGTTDYGTTDNGLRANGATDRGARDELGTPVKLNREGARRDAKKQTLHVEIRGA